MYAIAINHQFLDLSASSISVSIVNPIFDRDKIERVFTNIFTADTTPKNIAILKSAERIDVPGTGQVYENAQFYINNQLFRDGVIILKGSTNKSYKLNFQNAPIRLLDDMEEVSIQAYNSQHAIDYSFQETLYLTASTIPRTGIEFFTIKINDDLISVPYQNVLDIVDEINALYPGFATLQSQTINTISIILFDTSPGNPEKVVDTEPVVDNPIAHEFFYSNGLGNTLNDFWVDHLAGIIANPVTHVFPTFKNPNFFGGEEFKTGPESFTFASYLNYYTPDGKYPDNTNFHEIPHWRYSLVPFVFLAPMIESLAEDIGISQITGDFLDDPEIRQLLIGSNKTVDELIEAPSATGKLNRWLAVYNLGNFLPNLTIKDFLKYLSDTFCLYNTLDEGVIKIQIIKNILKSKVEDWTHLSEPEYETNNPTTSGFSLLYDRQGDETEITGQLEDVDGGLKAKKITAPFYTYFSITENDKISFTRNWTIPFLQEEGTSEPIDQINDITSRLIFWRGMQEDNDGNEYPMASAFTVNRQGEEIGEYSLDWNGEKGRYEKWWKEYINLVTNGEEVDKIIRLSINDLLALRRFDFPRKRINHEKGEMIGVVKVVRFSVSPTKGLSFSKVTFIKEP